jgi:hypothetical protein
MSFLVSIGSLSDQKLFYRIILTIAWRNSTIGVFCFLLFVFLGWKSDEWF